MRKNAEDGTPIEIEGKPGAAYVATLLNPVDHRLYDAVAFGNYIYLLDPRPAEDYENPEVSLVGWADGYIDRNDEAETVYDGDTLTLFRVHTPGGVVKKRVGLGLLLYSGLSLFSVVKGAEGIYSQKAGQGRSREAQNWWMGQVSKEYAEETQGTVSGCGTVSVDIDESTIDVASQAKYGHLGEDLENADSDDVSLDEYSPSSVDVEVCASSYIDRQFLPASKVAAYKLVVAWDSNDSDLDEICSAGNLPSPEVISEIDFTGVTDQGLVEVLYDAMVDNGADDTEKKRFWSRVPPEARSARAEQIIAELGGQLRLPLVANPAKHSKKWRKEFGDLLDSD